MKIKCHALLIVICFIFSCKDPLNTDKEKKLKKDPAYIFDVDKPDSSWQMPSELREISGITWMDATHLLAIEDLHASLYILSLSKQATVEKIIPFKENKDKKFDVEDITIAGNSES